MKISWVAAAASAAVVLLGSAPASAACRLGTTEVPVTMEGRTPKVTIKLNGQDARLILDSGATYNTIDVKFAQRANLKTATRVATGSLIGSKVGTEITGAGGDSQVHGYVTASTFEFLHAKFNDVPFITANVGSGDGLFGENFLHAFDNEYDLRNGMLRLVSPEGCKDGMLAYWVQPGMPYSVIPIEGTHGSNLITGTVLINGNKMRAVFDTGANQSFITVRAAAQAGVKIDPSATAHGEAAGIDRKHIKTWIAPFASVKIGSEEIKNTQLVVGDSDATFFDILIGADFFLSHHVLVANSQDKVYFTYSGGPVFDLSASHPSESGAAASPGK